VKENNNPLTMTSTPQEDPLYYTDKTPVYPHDFAQAFADLGITRGDCILIHSDISVFGKLASYNREYLFSSLINELKNAVTEEGTIIMPVFSYSFCENKVFEPERTKSKVGVLTEYFRNQQDVVRTRHPIFSFAIWGKNKESYLSISKDSFNQDSVFGKFHRNQGKILFLGAPFQSCTFIHYVEQMHGVPYRYIKKFPGVIKSINSEYADEYTYFVRDLNVDKNELDLSKLERYLIQKSVMKSMFIGTGRVLIINSEQLYTETWDSLNNDIEFLLKE
jgi:aminoglycoside 3-N-acetyltransferase